MRIDLPANGPQRRAGAAEMAALHRASLPDATTSRLGTGFLTSFYRLAEASDREILLVAEGGDRLAGVLLFSLDPSGLSGRLLRGTSLAWSALTRPWVIPRLLAGGDAKTGERLPELLFVFSDPACRGQGIGRSLLQRLDREMLARGIAAYTVATLDDPGNAAIGFYRGAGLVPAGSCQRQGRRFQSFVRHLSETH